MSVIGNKIKLVWKKRILIDFPLLLLYSMNYTHDSQFLKAILSHQVTKSCEDSV